MLKGGPGTMKKIIDYKEKDLNLQLIYTPGKEALDRKYNLKIIKDNKELITICITDNNSSYTIKNTYKALDELTDRQDYILETLKLQGLSLDERAFRFLVSGKYLEYFDKYQELKEKNRAKGIYYFN